ncbi:hypothetical protein [Pseudomaricurvus sp.]|uniref:hypothetical protein n=1 Tax=Pseudomaricurvus sp. TaxID=2004510 RepID=UPI003F6AC39E
MKFLATARFHKSTSASKAALGIYQKLFLKKSIQSLVMTLGALLSTVALSATVLEEDFDNGFGNFSANGIVLPLGGSVLLLGGFNSSITSSAINTQGFDKLTLSYSHGTSGLGNSENSTMAISVNDGDFTPLEATSSSDNQRVKYSLPAVANNASIRLRFSPAANGFLESIEIDNILLEGNNGAPPPVNNELPEIGDFVTFESGHVRPMALSSDSNRLYVVNTPDNRVEIFDVSSNTPQSLGSILVGLEPVALALRNDNELWVVNHLSDSVSVIDLAAQPARIIKTLLVGDEPRDIVFAGGNNPNSNQFAFISAAHRGQNVPFDPQLQTEGIGRADVWVFDSNNTGDTLTGTPHTILNMFGDTLRGLARNASGSRVYAAVLHSGNRTTVLTDDIGDGGITKAPPQANNEGFEQPQTGLIVQFDGNRWVDAGDPTRGVPPQDWSERVKLNLPDYDVFTIDTSSSTPRVIDQTSGVGTTLFNLAVNPSNDTVYVSNQEALNLNRFEGSGTQSTTVRGHFLENRITVIDGKDVKPRHLNKHIDYNLEGTQSERERALATPLQMAISSNGEDLYLAAMGSDKLARFSTESLESDSFIPETDNQLVLSGGGPTGVVLDELQNRAFVTTRYDNGVSIISTGSTMSELSHVTMFNPEPDVVVNGRRFLYDANYTSGHGDSSCAGCHTFADMDHLAWDLGNPDEDLAINPASYNENIPSSGRNPDLHPMKGPMTTQSFRGMKGNGPMHWRGDRTGVDADPDETLEEQAFEDFNIAFTQLLGRSSELSEFEMDAFAKFALELSYPPNPIANLDNGLTARQREALNIYNNVVSDTITTCNGCHRLDVTQNQFGTDGSMAIEGPSVEEDMKIPHLRNMYQKIGMFARNSQTNTPHLGDQIRGFGFDNSGSHGSVFSFLGEAVFTLNDTDARRIEELTLAFPSEMTPIVGQQVTVTAQNKHRDDIQSRVQLLINRALIVTPRPECDLIASAIVENQRAGYVMNSRELFISEKSQQAAVDLNDLLDLVNLEGNPVTFTCVPPGNGTRIGIDRDGDGTLNSDDSA